MDPAGLETKPLDAPASLPPQPSEGAESSTAPTSTHAPAPLAGMAGTSSGVQILPYDPEAGDDDDDDDEDGQGAGGEPPRKKRGGHGRRKIEIEYIDDKIRRHITFSKRKAGISKKAYELSRLTGAQVLLLISSERGQIYSFATPKLQPILVNEGSKQLIEQCLNAPDPSALIEPPPAQQQVSQAPPGMPPNMPQQQYMSQPPQGMHPGYVGVVPGQMPMQDPHHAAAMAHAQAQAQAHAQAQAQAHGGYMVAPDGSMIPSNSMSMPR